MGREPDGGGSSLEITLRACPEARAGNRGPGGKGGLDKGGRGPNADLTEPTECEWSCKRGPEGRGLADRDSNCLPYEDDTTLTWTERLVDRLPFVREQDTGREIRTRVRDPEIGVGREDATLVSGFPNSGGMPAGRTSSHLPSSGRGAAPRGCSQGGNLPARSAPLARRGCTRPLDCRGEHRVSV